MDAPAAAVSADGRKIAVAWMDMRNGRDERDVWWRTAVGGKFGPETGLAETTKNLQAHPALALDERGVVHAAWEDGRDGPTRIYYCTSAAPKNVALSDEGRCGFPSIAVGPKFVVVVYETGDEKVVCRVVE